MVVQLPANRVPVPTAAVDYLPLAYYPVSGWLVRHLPESFAREHLVVPLARQGDVLTVAMADPEDVEAHAGLRRYLASEVRPVASTASEIELALDRVFKDVDVPDTWPALLRVFAHTGFLTAHQVATLGKRREALESGANGVAQPDVAEALGLVLNLPRVRLDRYEIDPRFARMLPRVEAFRWQIVPVFPIGNEVVLATTGYLPAAARAVVKRLTGLEPRPVLCTRAELQRALEGVYDQAPVEGNRPFISPVEPLWPTLLDMRALEPGQVDQAQLIAAHTGEPVEGVLLRTQTINERQLLEALARQRASVLVNLAQTEIDPDVARVVPEGLARRYRCLALRQDRRAVHIALADLDNQEALRLLGSLFDAPIESVLCAEDDLAAALDRVYLQVLPARPAPPLVLGDWLVRSGWLTAQQVGQALQLQRKLGQRLGQCLLELKLLDEEALAEILALQAQLPWISVARYGIPAETLRLVPQDFAQEHQVLPLYQDGKLLTVATAEPFDAATWEALRQQAGVGVRAVLAAQSPLRSALDRLYAADLASLTPELQELGDVLVHRGLLTREQLLQAWHRQLQAGIAFDQSVVELGLATEEVLAAAIAQHVGAELADLRYYQTAVTAIDGLGVEREVLRGVEPVDMEVAHRLPESVARQCMAIAFHGDGETIDVAFANPVEADTRRSVQAQLDRPISVFVSPRAQVIEAQRRAYGRRALGDFLLQAGLINRRELDDALALHRRAGVRLGRALINLGYVTEEEVATCLSSQQDLPYFELAGIELNEDLARSIPESLARQHGMLPLMLAGKVLTLAMIDPLDAEGVRELEELTGYAVRRVVTTESDLEDALERIYHDDYLYQSASDLVVRFPDDSAIRVLATRQKVGLILFLVLSAALLYLDTVAYLVSLVALSTFFYISFSLYKFYLIYKALSHSLEVEVSDEEIAGLDDRQLPIYTVLVPLYHEAAVLPNLVRAIDNLDYPKTKLDVKLLLEEDDEETINTVLRHRLPSHFKPVIVPHALPKGKPKACNYGLIHAQGEYVVIYDAEDIPDRNQLKMALLGFRKASKRVGCIQAKLNYYNRDQNLLTRWFTTEYSMWFDLFIPGLDASNAAIPLGGTSNHFPTQLLQDLGAWDPYNVTEDADLGVRLFKAGWRTAVIDSTTYEEANSELYNWVRQRSRWVKGYVQTWLVHMRHPIKLWREIGFYQFFSFNMVVGGTFFGYLMNPIFWLLTAAWFLTRWSFIQDLFPGPLFYLGAMSLYVGNFAFMYTNVAGCMRRGYYDMVKYALISPMYWAMMSIGAWKGFLQLFYRPSYWEKTEHGLYRGPIRTPTTHLAQAAGQDGNGQAGSSGGRAAPGETA